MRDLLDECAKKTRVKKFLELGSFVGNSAIILAKHGVVICADRFSNNMKWWGKPERIYPDTLKSFWENVGKNKLIENVIAFKGEHKDFYNKISGKFGLIYIDGGHTIKDLIPAIEYSLKHLDEDGYLIFHDYGNENWSDVKKVVDNYKLVWDLKEYAIEGKTIAFKNNGK